jgi:tripartite-type tricarboxylate transporter receptor subunit TctC
MFDRRRLIALAGASALVPFAGCTAFAQGWPNRVVKLVVPFTPGGGIDAVGRIIGARLSEMWGQQVIVDNKPDSGGNIASEFVAPPTSRSLNEPPRLLRRVFGKE